MNPEYQSLNAKKSISPERIESAIHPVMFDADYARTFLVVALHGHLPACPWCKRPISGRQYDRFAQLKKIVCKQCGRKFNAFTGTIFSGANLEPRQLIGLILFIYFGFNTTRVAKYLGISPRAAATWLNKFKAARILKEAKKRTED